MPTKTDDDLRDMHFTRDPSLAGDIADAFGGGGGDATALIQANTLRYPEDLSTANDLAWNQEREAALIEAAGGRKHWYAEVAEAAGIEKVQAATLRGEDYVVFSFELPDGRIGKDVLYVDEDGALEAPEREDTPERAALRAQVQSTRHLRAARSEADTILADARAEAERILKEAADKAAEQGAERKAAAADAAADGRDEQPAPGVPVATGGTDADGGDTNAAADLDNLSFEDAKDRADKLGLEVDGTGRNGAKKTSDYVNALKAHAAGQGSQQA